jgi:hypothetical protein
MLPSEIDRPSMAKPLAIAFLLALVCPLVALTVNPIIGVLMGAVISALALPVFVYGLIRFKYRGLWFLLVLPIALSPVFIFFAMLCNAEPHQCNGWTFAKHFAPFW